jgi:hypothetical protein
MRKVGVFVFVLCAAVGLSLNLSAGEKAPTFDEWLGSQQGTCEENMTNTGFSSTVATPQSPCYVENNCYMGEPKISCTGTSYCVAGTMCSNIPYVECDGVRTVCPRNWCQTKLCCYAYKTCDYYCGGFSGCWLGCCECIE